MKNYNASTKNAENKMKVVFFCIGSLPLGALVIYEVGKGILKMFLN